jgi:hypothetical protein
MIAEVSTAGQNDETTPSLIDQLVELYWTFRLRAAEFLVERNDVLWEVFETDTLIYMQIEQFRAKTGVSEAQFTGLLPRGLPPRRRRKNASTTITDLIESLADRYLAACIGYCENVLHVNETLRAAESNLGPKKYQFCERVQINRRDIYSVDTKKINEAKSFFAELRANLGTKTTPLTHFIKLD